MTQHDADVLGEENPSSEIINSEEFHALLDSTMSRSVTQAIQSAMGLMSANIAQSISSALMNTNAPVTQNVSQPTGKRTLTTGPGRKASCKTHHTQPITSKKLKMGMATPATEAVVTPRKRAQYRAKSVRNWKAAKAALDYSSSESFAEEVSDESDEPDNDIPSEEDIPDNSAEVGLVTLPVPTDTATLLDPQGEPLFDPDNLQHPRSAEWFPADHIAKYIAARVRKPLDKITRNKLRAECPRPTVPDLACDTPEVDPKIAQFLGKSGWKAKKGLDFSLRVCQDKVLDIMGPCAKIFELVETGLSNDTPVDLPTIKGWIQRVICLIGNANTAIATERRKAILLKIEPKLVNMAVTEPGPQAKGLLFGDNFVKELGSFVHTFTALDKAQSNMKRVFQNKVFGGAGRFRGRLPGRGSRGPFRGSRGPTSTRSSFVEHRPASTAFFPQRSRPWQNRGARGSYQSRRPYGKPLTNTIFFPCKSRWQIMPISTPMVRHYLGPLGATDSVRVSHRLCDPSGSVDSTPFDPFFATRSRIGLTRGFKPPLKRCHHCGTSRFRRVPQQPVSGPQKGRWYSPSYQSAPTKCLRRLPTLQNGRHSLFTRPTPPRRLDGEAGPSGRLPDGTYSCCPSTLPQVSVESPNMAIHLSPIRTLISPMVFHEVVETRDEFSTQERRTTDYLFGRLIAYVARQVDTSTAPILDGGHPSSTRIPDQLGKVMSVPISVDGIPGIRHQFNPRVFTPTKVQSEIHSKRDQESFMSTSDHYSTVGSSHRLIGGLHPGNIPRSSSLQGPSTTEDTVPTDWSDIRSFDSYRLQRKGRTIMVVDSHRCLERQGHFRYGTRSYRGVRCQLTRLGRAMRSYLHRWSLVSRRESPSHQLFGTPRRRICDSKFRRKLPQLFHPATTGQHLSGSVHKPPGWHEISESIPSGDRVLEILPGTQHLGEGRTYPGIVQYGCGLELTSPRRFQRLEITSTHFSPTRKPVESFGHRSFCISPQYPAAEVLQLETRPRSVGVGCLSPDMAVIQTLRFPSILSDFSHVNSPASQRRISGPGDSLVGLPTVVPHSAGTIVRHAATSPILVEPHHQLARLSSPIIGHRSASVSSLVGIRGPWFIPGVPCSTLALLEGAWAPGTRQSYRRAWDMWASWCMEHHSDPVSAPVSHILRFLTLLYENGRAYRTINVYRSAISAGHSGFGGFSAGKQLLVCRLLKGIRLARPPVPRYSSLWDVNVILLLFEHWPDNSDLTFQQLSSKLVMLFCLISCKRVSYVRALDVSSRSFTPEGVLFNISRRTKTLITSVFYPSFPHHPKLCPVLCLKEYELRTSVLRDPERPELFLALRKPHRPVATTSLARWVKWVLHSAGVDTSIFGPHSTRGAMASKAFALGCRLEDLLKAADWSRESTFREFYFRAPSHFSDSVIAQL
ncbi:uncharacterized protein RCH25_037941 [Pelodytes ibericus]